MSSRIMKRANRATPSEIVQGIPSTLSVGGICYTCQVATGPDLGSTDREYVWQIFEDNMKGLYVNSAFGWDPQTKRRELFHPLSRYILLYGPQDKGSGARPNSGAILPLMAYVAFRFEQEEGENVVYCYELQVSKAGQRKGLGTFLMRQIYNVGRRWQIYKVMLTVLKANATANEFYKSQGFTTDPTSPGYGGDIESIHVNEESDESESEGEQSKISRETLESDDDAWEDEMEEFDYEILSKHINTSGP